MCGKTGTETNGGQSACDCEVNAARRKRRVLRVQGALDTCARLVDEHSVTEVAAAVAALLRSGALH